MPRLTKKQKLHIATAEKMTRIMGFEIRGKASLELCEANWKPSSIEGFVASIFPSGADAITIMIIVTLDEDTENEETVPVMFKLKDTTEEQLLEEGGIGIGSRVRAVGVLRLGNVYEAGPKASKPGELRCPIQLVHSKKVDRHIALDVAAEAAAKPKTIIGKIPSAQENRDAREDFARDAATTFRSNHEVVGLAVSKEELEALADAVMPQPSN